MTPPETHLNNSTDPYRTTKVMGAFACVYLIWGSTYLAMRFTVESIPPFLSAGTRFVVAGGLILAFVAATGTIQLSKRQLAVSAAAGALMLTGANGLVSWAVQFVPSGVVALILGTTPLWIVMMDWLFFGGERPTFAVTAGLLLGLCGVAILAKPSSLVTQPVPVGGAIAALSACALWALGSLVSRSPANSQRVSLSTAIQMLSGGIGLLFISVVSGELTRWDVSAVTNRSVFSWLYLVFFGAILAFSCYVWLFRTCRPSVVSTYAFVNPVVAVIVGYFIGKEPISRGLILAAALILSGVFLVTTSRRSTASNHTSSDGGDHDPQDLSDRVVIEAATSCRVET